MKIKDRKRALVRILNPRDTRTHTSMRMAAYFVQRGDAVYIAGQGLKFVDDREARILLELQRKQAAEKLENSIANERPGGAIWWNGSDPAYQATGKQFNRLPFTASVFSSPDGAGFERSRNLQFTGSSRKPSLEELDRSAV